MHFMYLMYPIQSLHLIHDKREALDRLDASGLGPETEKPNIYELLSMAGIVDHNMILVISILTGILLFRRNIRINFVIFVSCGLSG